MGKSGKGTWRRGSREDPKMETLYWELQDIVAARLEQGWHKVVTQHGRSTEAYIVEVHIVVDILV